MNISSILSLRGRIVFFDAIFSFGNIFGRTGNYILTSLFQSIN